MSIESTIYVHGRKSGSASLAEAREACREPSKFAWTSILEPGDEDLRTIAQSFGLDSRALKDAIRSPHRARIEEHENLLVAVLPVAHAFDIEGDTRGELEFERGESDWVVVLAVRDRNAIITVVDGDPSVPDNLRRDVEDKPERMVEGSAAVLFEIVDQVVGGYEAAVEAIDQGISEAQNSVFESRTSNVLRRIHALTSKTSTLQQAVKPLAAALEHLHENDAPVSHKHLSSTRHRVLRVTERLDSSRDLLSNLLGVNLTMVGQKISAWGAILIVPTLIAGVFGMNFTQEWWTRAEHGFEVMIVVMLLVSGGLYLWFRKSGWL